MKNLTFLLLMLTLIPSCAWFSSAEKKHYYQLHYNPVTKFKKSFDATVRIKPFVPDKIYTKHNIVYRVSPYELFYYNNHFWASRPADMVTEAFRKHMSASGLFREVIVKLEKIPDFVVKGTINALDEIDSEERWFARLSMNLTFIDSSTGEVVVSHTFDRRKEVFVLEPVYVVRALGEIFEEESSVFLKKIENYLR